MINKIKEKEKNANLKLRVAVDSGGCKGHKYSFDLDEKKNEGDVVIERNGAQVLIDEISLPLLQGAYIDHQKEMVRAGFKIMENPQSDKECSCGHSFSTKD